MVEGYQMTTKIAKTKLKKWNEHRDFYQRITGKTLNIINPQDFNEKIQWLILNYYGPKEGELADKEAVKKYVAKLKIPGLKIPKTLKTYTDANDINLDELPEKFVLKCNHFSGDVFICKDKKHFDLVAAKKRLNEVLKQDFADINLEYHYSYIKPLIMAEEYLNDGEHKNPLDYKFYCFNGKAESILVCSNRENKLKLNDFDLDWHELDYTTDEYRSRENFARPAKLKEMTRIAEALSKNLPFVRVDLYEINHKIYFGEYTFTPAAGVISYYQQKALDHLGKKLDLTKYHPEAKGCDIVIPIYNAYNYLAPCMDSIIKNTNFKNNHLILIDDKSSDSRVLPLLEKYQKSHKDKITLLKNDKNLGFVKTTNAAMRYSNRNILLLNSDTIVPPNWLDEIVKCAKQDQRIATVTPFSNNLTPIKPLPENFRKKGFPDGYTFSQMASLINKYSLHLSPELPTSHGFCMYIKRSALNLVGYFDEDSFGKGYGEENDFSFRCLEFGYQHILCDNIYVLHAGAQSFLGKRKFHNDILAKKYPKTIQMVGDWYGRHEIDIITDNIILALGADKDRVNILVILDKSKKLNSEIIKELQTKYNLHILESASGNYTLHSFFKDADLMTAIYQKPVAIHQNESDNKEYQKMLDEIKKIYGISVISNITDKNQLIQECQTNGETRKINYLCARDKLIEYDFFQNIIQNNIIKHAKDETEKIQAKTPTLEQASEIKKPKNPSISQRIYLKVRYKLFGY